MCWWKSRSPRRLDQAVELAGIARETGLVLQVGHLERFSAAHGALTARMGTPLYIEAVRIAPFKPRGTDVSVILDLMIHDLDLILALTDAPILHVDAVGAPVASAHDDIANARIRFTNGAVATITASRISLKTERKMRIFSQTGYLTVDFAARKLSLVGRGIGMKLPGFEEFGVEQAGWQDHDALAAEHEAFFASVLDGAPVLVDAEAGRRALEAALAVSVSIAESRAMAEASGLIAPFIPAFRKKVRKWPLFEKSGAITFATFGPVALKPARPSLKKFFCYFLFTKRSLLFTRPDFCCCLSRNAFLRRALLIAQVLEQDVAELGAGAAAQRVENRLMFAHRLGPAVAFGIQIGGVA